MKLKTAKERSYIEIVEDFKKQKCLTLEQILKSKRLSAELRKEIEKSYPRAQNRTSIALLHQPVQKSCYHLICLNDTYFRDLYMEPEHCNTILTGDLELQKNDDFELLNYDRCFVFQYPHHGSKNNDLKRFHGNLLNIISCGIMNRHGHPHETVLKQTPNIVIVNERNAFEYQIVTVE